MTLTGIVEKIDDGTAYLTLEDKDGEVSYATIEASKLTDYGIGDGDRFQLEVRGDIVFTKIPRERPTDEEIEKIDEELDGLLPDSLLKKLDS